MIDFIGGSFEAVAGSELKASGSITVVYGDSCNGLNDALCPGAGASVAQPAPIVVYEPEICACASHDSFSCYDNDEYWYDSCGVREDKKQDCGNDSIGAWGTSYCKADDSLYHSRVIHQRGCAGSSCYDNISIEEKLVDPCDDSNPATIDTCEAGACVYTSICTPKTCFELGKECGTWYDGCEDIVDCGVCDDISGMIGTCVSGACVYTPIVTPATLSLSVVDRNNVVVDDYNPIYPGESVTVEWIPVNMSSCSGIPTNLGFSSTPGSVVHTPIFSNTPPPPYEYTYTINCKDADDLSYSKSVIIKSTRDNGICDPGETYPTAPKDCPFTYEPF